MHVFVLVFKKYDFEVSTLYIVQVKYSPYGCLYGELFFLYGG